MQHLYERIFYNEQANKLFTSEATITYMLRFEGALAQAQAKHGIIPGEAASIINECCKAENINKDRYDETAINAAIPSFASVFPDRKGLPPILQILKYRVLR